MNSPYLPDTRRGRAFRKLLAFLFIASIAGITLTLRSLVSQWMDVGFDPAGLEARFLAFNGILLAGWGLVSWVSYRGTRRNMAPPAWALAAVVGLSWAAIYVNRLG